MGGVGGCKTNPGDVVTKPEMEMSTVCTHHGDSACPNTRQLWKRTRPAGVYGWTELFELRQELNSSQHRTVQYVYMYSYVQYESHTRIIPPQ